MDEERQVPDDQPREIEIEGENGSSMLHLRCPYCGALDRIIEVTQATRWNKVDEAWQVDGDIHVHWATDETTVNHTRFCCGECDMTIALSDAMYHSSDDAPEPRRIDPAHP